jgi:predicted nucleic acid-binding protein
MKSVAIETLPESEAAEQLAAKYIEDGVLSQNHYNDCLHLAYATVYECDALVSWNFKHLVRASTVKGARTVNSTNRYGEIGIVSPATLIGGDGK